ncbi:MAG: FAD-dependent oxidoreductase [candidate division Zixibacteria bacterium]|nr:FAD-dependent oxidoreductase [candidate division Zixibacteria bacterium]
MRKLLSVDEFIDFRRRVHDEATGRGEELTLVVCAGTGGQASGSNDVIRVIKRYILDQGLQERVRLRITGCQGFCEMDPFIVVEPGEHLYPQVRMEDVSRIIEAALDGRVDEELIYREPGELKPYHHQGDIPFFGKQTRTLLGNNQKLDPIRIFDYVEQGGYAALEKVLANPDPEWIINEVKASGLRGRGGAGFPTGKKWELGRASGKRGVQKYVVCNADEGDPGAYMDRSLLEGNPHAIIEGLLIGGIAIGAAKGFVYVRSEYPLAIKHLLIALRQAHELGLLGEDILGTGLSFDVEIVRGAGAFVCGEETALMRSIEGKIGEPRQRPPYPVRKGIDGKPTVINNVETWANVPVVIREGAAAFAKVGTPTSTGTKIFSLVGKVKNTGLVEVPMGITVDEIVYDIGGGPSGRGRIKAVQTGGPSGGCIPASRFDLAIDYDSLAEAGSIMGSGGMIVMDEDTCMVDVAKYFMNFLKDESCGKCFTCRKGTQRMYELLDDITRGEGTPQHLELLEELALAVADTTMCGLGQTAPNPVLSTLRYFRHEYERHILDKRCDAFVCRDLVGAPCRAACPLGTEAWRYVALLEKGDYDGAYRVIREANPFPSVCARVCHHPCEDKCRAGITGEAAVAIRALKRFVTDRVDAAAYVPVGADNGGGKRVAIIGAGPAGLTAAHYLSLAGYGVTVFEAADRPGGMLVSGIPAYRLPRDVLENEIDALLDERVTLKLDAALGRDVTIDGLFEKGFEAIFLATGAHRSRRLDVPGEDAKGVYPSIEFLKSFNLRGQNLARGRVGVVGGGNSAVDAARVAVRQKGVASVTIYYRRTRAEMPAYAEEIEGALDEGVELVTLVSPVAVEQKKGRLTAVKFIKNELGERDASGRRRPVAVPGTEYAVPLDTLVVAISEEPETDAVAAAGIDVSKWGAVQVNPATFETNRPGVFSGGDAVRGPNTVVEAIADGKKAAVVIDRYLRGEDLRVPADVRLPEVFVEAAEVSEEEAAEAARAEPRYLAIEKRKKNFAEVELSLAEGAARAEARRCLRCDLEFTQPEREAEEVVAVGEEQA